EHVILKTHWKSEPLTLLPHRFNLENAAQLVALVLAPCQREHGLLNGGAMRLRPVHRKLASCDLFLSTDANEPIISWGDSLARCGFHSFRAPNRDIHDLHIDLAQLKASLGGIHPLRVQRAGAMKAALDGNCTDGCGINTPLGSRSHVGRPQEFWE